MKSTGPLFFLLSLLFLASCGSDKSGSDGKDSLHAGKVDSSSTSYIKDSAYYLTLPKNPARLSGGYQSDTLLIRAILEDLAQNDAAALDSLLITQDEFLTILFPELGLHWSGARDMRPETKEFLWTNQRGGAMKGLRRAIRDLGGKKLQLKGFSYPEGSQEYISYTIHNGTELKAIGEDGKEHTIRAIGSIVEKGGVFKLLSFRDKDSD